MIRRRMTARSGFAQRGRSGRRHEARDVLRRKLGTQERSQTLDAVGAEIVVEVLAVRTKETGLDPERTGSFGQSFCRALAGAVVVPRDV